MEEIRFLSSVMEFSFSCVYHESNMLADVLDKDGASSATLVFDV